MKLPIWFNQDTFFDQKLSLYNVMSQYLPSNDKETTDGDYSELLRVTVMDTPNTLEGVIEVSNMLNDGLRFGNWPWSDVQIPAFLQKQAD